MVATKIGQGKDVKCYSCPAGQHAALGGIMVEPTTAQMSLCLCQLLNSGSNVRFLCFQLVLSTAIHAQLLVNVQRALLVSSLLVPHVLVS